MYRTFNNITKGADLSVHTFLCELADWKTRNGCYPEEIFIQIDGGSENANKTVIALCEYLIVKRLIKTITLTRLPTGHTHEDIDATFAHIWRGMFNFNAEMKIIPKLYFFVRHATKKYSYR